MPSGQHHQAQRDNHQRDTKIRTTREPFRVPERQQLDELHTPRVRLAQVSLDESMFSILVRIDKALMTRERVGDTETLNRIQELFTSRFRNFGL